MNSTDSPSEEMPDFDNSSTSILPQTNDTNVSHHNVADAAFDRDLRIIVLYVEIIIGAIGGFLACSWLWINRRRKSRMNQLLLHVTLSDLLVIFAACLPQLIWEYDRRWKAGLVACKLLKFIQSLSMMASNNMLVVLSLDRMQAIRRPLRNPIAVWKMTLVGWTVAALLSLPQFGVYHTHIIDQPSSPFHQMMVCESIWRLRPHIERQIYLTFIGLVVFDIPFIIIMVCYVSIVVKVSQKAAESSDKNTSKPGKLHLQSTGGTMLTKAKIKTVKMTIVILTAFIICGLPYHVLEAIYNFGDHTSVPPALAAIIGAMAVANSAINPYVFLIFNWNNTCFHSMFHGRNRGYDDGIDYTVDNTRTETTVAPDSNNHAIRMTKVKPINGKKIGHSYSKVTSEEEY